MISTKRSFWLSMTMAAVLALGLIMLTQAARAEEQGGEKPTSEQAEGGGKKAAGGGRPGAGGGPPPAPVALGSSRAGEVAPHSEFLGNLRFTEVSQVAAEVSGRVLRFEFEEGRRVRAGAVLVVLDDELIEKRLMESRASLEGVQVELKEARRDLDRMENLFREDSVAEQVYDRHRFGVERLESRVASIEAQIAALETEKGKKRIKAPFGGVVLERMVDRGEWVSPGTAVAVLAGSESMEARLAVPENVVALLERDTKVMMRSSAGPVEGRVIATVPRGDVKTRTFPLRIGITSSTDSLMQGMEVSASLPIGRSEEAIMVHRDAVIERFGRKVIFTVDESMTASMVPVEVVGYQDLEAGVRAEGLEPGVKVVTKGNERLRDGQKVAPLSARRERQSGPAGPVGGKKPGIEEKSMGGEKPAPERQ